MREVGSRFTAGNKQNTSRLSSLYLISLCVIIIIDWFDVLFCVILHIHTQHFLHVDLVHISGLCIILNICLLISYYTLEANIGRYIRVAVVCILRLSYWTVLDWQELLQGVRRQTSVKLWNITAKSTTTRCTSQYTSVCVCVCVCVCVTRSYLLGTLMKISLTHCSRVSRVSKQQKHCQHVSPGSSSVQRCRSVRTQWRHWWVWLQTVRDPNTQHWNTIFQPAVKLIFKLDANVSIPYII